MRNKKKFFLKILKPVLFFLILAGLVFGLTLFLKSDFFKVQKIICQLKEEPCPSEIWLDLVSLTIGRNIFFLSSQSLVSQIKKDNPLFKEVKVSKNLPNQVSFDLEKREPQVAIKGLGQELLVVDDEGYLLTRTKTSDLPLLIVNDLLDFEIGEPLGKEEIIWSISLFKGLKLRLFEPKSVRIITPRQIETELAANGPLVIFSSQKELDFQLDSLQLIFSRAKIEGKDLKRLDLRFDKPVVVYE